LAGGIVALSAIPRKAAICDANVLIDFIKADEAVLAMLPGYWESVYVPDIVLSEVRQLSAERAGSLRLTIIETPLSIPDISGLSFPDRVCLYFATREGWVCIANDRRLRNECQRCGIQTVWGLEMLLLLVESGTLAESRARRMAMKIHSENPQITKKVMDDFLGKLGQRTRPRKQP
jgi:rRNA-processing protein FCF1